MKLLILWLLAGILSLGFALIPEALMYYAWTVTAPAYKSLMILGMVMVGPGPCVLFAWLGLIGFLFLCKLAEEILR